jgi:hypothetical protein
MVRNEENRQADMPEDDGQQLEFEITDGALIVPGEP